MGDNREFELKTIEDPSLSTHSYQLLPLATSQLVGNNREFDVSGTLEGVFPLLVEGSLWQLKIHH